MNGKVINSCLIHDVVKMKFKSELLIYMMEKISNYYWFIIDNLAFKLDKLVPNTEWNIKHLISQKMTKCCI